MTDRRIRYQTYKRFVQSGQKTVVQLAAYNVNIQLTGLHNRLYRVNIHTGGCTQHATRGPSPKYLFHPHSRKTLLISEFMCLQVHCQQRMERCRVRMRTCRRTRSPVHNFRRGRTGHLRVRRQRRRASSWSRIGSRRSIFPDVGRVVQITGRCFAAVHIGTTLRECIQDDREASRRTCLRAWSLLDR
jgi:hypothetical protein